MTGNPLADVGQETFTKLDAIVVSHRHGSTGPEGEALGNPAEFVNAKVAIPFVKQVRAGGRKAFVVQPGASLNLA